MTSFNRLLLPVTSEHRTIIRNPRMAMNRKTWDYRSLLFTSRDASPSLAHVVVDAVKCLLIVVLSGVNRGIALKPRMMAYCSTSKCLLAAVFSIIIFKLRLKPARDSAHGDCLVM